jgi:hypothetical protein
MSFVSNLINRCLRPFPTGWQTTYAIPLQLVVGSDLDFNREPANAVAAAIVEGIEAGSPEVVRGCKAKVQMVGLNQTSSTAPDERFLGLKPALEAAVGDRDAL